MEEEKPIHHAEQESMKNITEAEAEVEEDRIEAEIQGWGHG